MRLSEALRSPPPVRAEPVEAWALLASSQMGGVLVRRAGAGERARRRGNFLLSRQEGVEKIYFIRPSSIRACASQTHACAYNGLRSWCITSLRLRSNHAWVRSTTQRFLGIAIG